MRFELDDYHRNVDSAEFLADIRRVADLLATDRLTRDAYVAHGKYHPSTIVRRFGSWFRALEASGLKKTRTLSVTQDDLLTNLESVWERLGRQPRYDNMRAPLSLYSAKTYSNHFGSWRHALSRFVLWVNQEEIGDGATPEPADPVGIGAPAGPVSTRLRFKVLERDHFRCVACGRSPATHAGLVLHVDHRRPRAKGGLSDIDNLQTLCQDCNLGKSDSYPSQSQISRGAR